MRLRRGETRIKQLNLFDYFGQLCITTSAEREGLKYRDWQVRHQEDNLARLKCAVYLAHRRRKYTYQGSIIWKRLMLCLIFFLTLLSQITREGAHPGKGKYTYRWGDRRNVHEIEEKNQR